MSDDELFENWWRVHSPPGTFDKAQCKIAFVAGLVTQRVNAAEQSFAPDAATGAPCRHRFDDSLYCSFCGEAQF